MPQERELVPRWMLRKICERNGMRLPKRELFKPVQTQLAIVGPTHRVHDKAPNCTIERQQVTLGSKAFDFENWEYRFWCVEVADGAPLMAMCRRCNGTFFHRKPRRAHLSDKGCSKAILKAYSLLLRDKKCVVCDAWTAHTEWGVPLCNKNDCQDLFMHEDVQPGCLESALLMASNAELISR